MNGYGKWNVAGSAVNRFPKVTGSIGEPIGRLSAQCKRMQGNHHPRVYQLTVERAGFIGDLHPLACQPSAERSVGSFGNRNALHSYLHVSDLYFIRREILCRNSSLHCADTAPGHSFRLTSPDSHAEKRG